MFRPDPSTLVRLGLRRDLPSEWRHPVLDQQLNLTVGLRGTPGRALGGKLLAVLEVQSDLVVGLHSDADADVNEQALLPGLLDQVRATLPGQRLWIADRAFGTLANFKRCTAEGDHCILRKTVQGVFRPSGTSAAIQGTDIRERAYRDETGTLSSNRAGAQAAGRSRWNGPATSRCWC